MDNVNVPGVGNVDKKYLYVAGAGVTGYVGYRYYKNRQNASAATTTDPNATTGATDPNAVDPNAATYDPSLSGYGYGGNYDTSSGVYQSPVNQTIPVASGQQITTDAAWDSAAVAAAGDIGSDGGSVSSALGRFLANLCLSDVQADIVRRVEGMFGRPPQSPQLEIHICPPSGSGGGSVTPGTVGGLRVTSTTKTTVGLSWNPATNAVKYQVDTDGHAFRDVGNVTSYRATGLHSNTHHTFRVRAYSSTSPGSASSISAQTKR